jgi:hypothetical protein
LAGYNKLVKLNLDLKNEMYNLRTLLVKKNKKINEGIISNDILSQRKLITSNTQPIQCPLFKPRSTANCWDRQVIKLQYIWYIKDYRKKFMRLMAVLSGLLSILVIGIEVLFFLQKF